jgi:biopolymer transport protein ExbB/TolQ
MLTQYLLRVVAIGGEWVLWLLIALSVYSFGIIVDRAWFFATRKVDIDKLGKELVACLERGDRVAACALLDKSASVEAAVARTCLDWLDAGPDAMSEVLAATLRAHKPTLDKGTVQLGTIGSNSPFVGLFGTVLGIISAFRELGSNAAGGMTNVMTGIGEALVATAAGIAVAIPGIVAFNIFSSRAAAVEERALQLMSLVLAVQKKLIHQAGEPKAGEPKAGEPKAGEVGVVAKTVESKPAKKAAG